VLETVGSFWKSGSKDRFRKLKYFALKCTRCLETRTYMCESMYIFYDEASQI